jgi:hypothetical protein
MRIAYFRRSLSLLLNYKGDDMKNFKAGEKVWVILGSLIIRVKIINVNNDIYTIDEPYPYSIMEYDLFKTKEEAIEEFKISPFDINKKETLNSYRRWATTIPETELGQMNKKSRKKYISNNFPRKSKKRWINLFSI